MVNILHNYFLKYFKLNIVVYKSNFNKPKQCTNHPWGMGTVGCQPTEMWR